VSDDVIVLTAVGKSYPIFEKPVDRLLDAFGVRKQHRVHCALQDISFSVKRGEAVAVLGENGAGKSTLLKLITGIAIPDAGNIAVSGRVTGLLELGTGFDGTLSGRQNIRINASLIGMDASEIDAKEESIIAFAELGSFIDAPVRTYSSGMVMRLGFAIAIHADPVCFVVDEALSVGDARFQQKCIKRIREFRAAGGSILLVSHDLNSIKLICDRAILLNKGRIVCEAAPEIAIQTYYQLIAGLDDSSRHAADGGNYGKKQVRISSVELLDEHGNGVQQFTSGSRALLRIGLDSDVPYHPSIGFLIRDRFGQDIFGTNTVLLGLDLSIEPGKKEYVFEFPMNLGPGKYGVTVAVHTEDSHVHDCQHWIDNAVGFEVAGFVGSVFSGICSLPVRFSSLPSVQ